MFPCARCGSDRTNIEAECTRCGWRPKPLAGNLHTKPHAKANWYQTDSDHLRLLSIFHYVVAGILVLFSLFPVIHLAMGIAMVTGAFDEIDNGNPLDASFGWFFIIFPLIFILCGLTMSVFVAVAGRRLARHTGHTFCLVVAGIECIFIPFGTVLGVFTIIVLLRPTVKERFGVAEIAEP